MPTTNTTPSWFGGNLTLGVQNGSVSESRLDDMVRRVMTPYFALGQDRDFPLIDPSMGAYPQVDNFEAQFYWKDQYTAAGVLGEASRDVRGNHSALIRELGAAGSVLLKNVKSALPLVAPKRIGIFGNAAGDLTTGPYYQSNEYEYGCLPAGGGSGTGRFSQLTSPLEAIKTRAAKDGALLQYILNNTQLAVADGYATSIFPQPDVCLVFIKTWAAEDSDRTTLASDWDGDAVVEKVAAGCNNTIVISQSTGINILPWASHPNVTAILASHLSGEQIGNSLVDILYGDYNPSGKLPYSLAFNATDYDFAPVVSSVKNKTDPNAWQSDFTERLLIDYRHFDYYNVSVQYEFGFGLSYTNFSLSSLSITSLGLGNITALPAAEDPVAPGGNSDLWSDLFKVTAVLKNTGSIAGAGVAQLYVTLPDSAPAGTPINQLRGFEKAMLAAGQEETVEFLLARRDISFWDVDAQQWRIPSGTFGVNVGFSSRDFKLSGKFNV